MEKINPWVNVRTKPQKEKLTKKVLNELNKLRNSKELKGLLDDYVVITTQEIAYDDRRQVIIDKDSKLRVLHYHTIKSVDAPESYEAREDNLERIIEFYSLTPKMFKDARRALKR